MRTTLRFWSKVKTADSVHVKTSLNIIRQNIINLLTVFRQKLFEFKSLDLSMGLRLYLSLLSTTTFFLSVGIYAVQWTMLAVLRHKWSCQELVKTQVEDRPYCG